MVTDEGSGLQPLDDRAIDGAPMMRVPKSAPSTASGSMPLLTPRPSLVEKVLAKIRRGRFWPAVYARLRPWIMGLWRVLHDPAAGVVTLHAPSLVATNPADAAIVERIFHAYRLMKVGQEKAEFVYQPSSFWSAILAEGYADLVAGMQVNDIRRFHYFLENFGAWPRDHAIESTMMVQTAAKSFVKSRYLRNDIFYKQLDFWKWFYNHRKPVSSLSYPMVGNQSGAYIDGVFVGVGSFFNEIYGSILSGLLTDTDRPVVAELGAGYGKFSWFILRDRERFAYLDFDLPETLCLAAYYLMKVHPTKRVLLYGEEEFTQASMEHYDLVFLPCYEISKLAPRSIDLFLNKNSLGEMTGPSVMHYTSLISRATKRYFFHMNHDVTRNFYSDQNEEDRGLLGYEYPISGEEFKLIFRYPDFGSVMVPGSLSFRSDIFLYLYERKVHQGAGCVSPI